MSETQSPAEKKPPVSTSKPSLIGRFPLHPVLIALFPLAYLFSVNVNYTNLWELPRAIIVVTALALLTWGAARLVLPDRHKAALFASLMMTALFTYGLLLDSLRPWQLGKHVLVAPVELLILLAVLVMIRRSKRDFTKVSYALNVLGVCLLAVSLSSSAMQYDWSAANPAPDAKTVAAPTTTEQQTPAATPAIAPSDLPANLPSIYYIVPDAYGRSDVLLHRYQCDISWFLDALRQRGFYIADQASSNYWVTLFSLSSSMTMNYHENLAERWKPDDNRAQITTKRQLRADVAEGPVISKLRAAGYTIVSFSSGFSVSETVDPDVYIGPGEHLSEFEQGVIDLTPLRWVLPRVHGISPYRLHRQRIEYLFDHFKQAAKIPGPKFVLIHLPVPHPPFVFGADGQDVSPYKKPFGHRHNDGPLPYGEVNQDFVNKYRDQVNYTSKRLLEGIDDIIKEEDSSSVIILQGDHGPMANRGMHGETYFPGERFPILSAYLLPPPEVENATAFDQSQIEDQKSKINPYPSISPVNSFRLVFNRYFGDDYPLLEDLCIANASGMGVVDMTEQVPQEVAEINSGRPMVALETPDAAATYPDDEDMDAD